MAIELLSGEGYRIDGRKSNEIRKISCNIGIFTQADGSAYLEQGGTKILAAVYGPHEIRAGKGKPLYDKALINCQYSMAVFSTVDRKQRPRGDRKSVEMTQHLQQTFESCILTDLYPRSQIDIYLEVLHSDGSNYSACINAATLALVDAGIPLRGLVCSCTATRVDTNMIVDTSHIEESGMLTSGPTLTLALLYESSSKSQKNDQIVLVEMDGGRLHEDLLEPLLETATRGCQLVKQTISEFIRHKLSRMASLSNADSVD